MTRSEWPLSTSLRSPLVSVSANTTVTRFSLIRVLAFVGPRPVYSCSSCTAAVEIIAEGTVSPWSVMGHLPVRFLGGGGHHKRGRKRWSPKSSGASRGVLLVGLG